MRMPPELLVSPAMTIVLISTIVIFAIILLASNTITITNAQQQPPLNSQPIVTQNRTTLFQSAEDAVRLNVPEDWVIHDVNNTGSMLSQELTQGYAILAQLCPQEEEQEQTVLSNVSVSGNTTMSCQGSEGEVIHIVRYPDLDNRLFANNATTTNSTMITTDNVLTYHLQKLEEVGYGSMQIVNSTDRRLNVTNAQTNQTISTVPAQFVEMIYNTASAPDETREGYFILTATNATQPNIGTTKGYSIFYEGGNSSATISETTAPPASLALRPLAPPVKEVFDSFELVSVVVAPTEQPLTVEITSNDTEATAPAAFEFEADITGGIEPYAINWNFGDGSSDDDADIVDHTFEEAGSYNVNLTVTDSRGQSASDSVEITLEEAPPAEEEEEEVEEEPIPIPPPPPPPAEEEEEEEEPIPSPPPADDVAEDIEDEVDAFVQELLDRFGVENPGLP
jgi:PKD repeat protein